MKKRLLFIYNAHAGKAQIRSKLIGILDVFAKEGYEIIAAPTQKQGDAACYAREMGEDLAMIVCSGGDGTLDEVVTGMVQGGRRLPVGYIPCGSTNDFAKSLKIPGNMLHAAQIAVGGEALFCDVGRFNEDAFIYIAAFGLFTDVSYETRQSMKNVLGHMAYITEGMKRIPSVKKYHLKVSCAELETEDDFIFGMVTNSLSVGGFKRITGRNVELDDGLFEVTLIKMPGNPFELNKILVSLTTRILDTDYMYCFKTAAVTFASEQELPWTLDGEFGGIHREVKIRNLQRALEMRVPPKKT